MNALAEQIKHLPPLKDLKLVVQPDTGLAELRKLPRDNYKTIEARGFLHRKLNFAEWVNTLWGLLAPGGALNIVVPHGEASWADPLAAREINGATFARFDVRGEAYNQDCKPFQAVILSVLGSDLHAGLKK